jgi:hypothetical protein
VRACVRRADSARIIRGGWSCQGRGMNGSSECCRNRTRSRSSRSSPTSHRTSSSLQSRSVPHPMQCKCDHAHTVRARDRPCVL